MTSVTVKGQVTLPKAVREAAGIRPGDRVSVRLRPEGGVIVEREPNEVKNQAFLEQLNEIARRKPFLEGPFGEMSSDEIIRHLRGDD